MRAWLLLLVACGGGSSGPATPSGPPAASIAVPAPGDVQVATVNGRPIWGSCVADQIKRTPMTRQVALQQCVDLELLAQTAEGKQLATIGEVVDATRTALVRRLVDTFEAKYPDPDSLRAQIDEMYKKAGTTRRPEIRVAWHALVNADKNASETVHAAARQAAEQLYQRLKDETGMFAVNLKEAAAAQETPGMKIPVDELVTTRDDVRWAAEFRGALFGIPDVGRVSPVVKTEHGYHVILLAELRPEAAIEREQIFAGLRRQLFVQYVNELTNQRSTEIYPERLEPPDEVAP